MAHNKESKTLIYSSLGGKIESWAKGDLLSGKCDDKKNLFIYLLQYTYKNLEAKIYTLIYNYI